MGLKDDGVRRSAQRVSPVVGVLETDGKLRCRLRSTSSTVFTLIGVHLEA